MKTQKKRRQQHKTDYKKRLNLLKSEIPRLVFRKTNKYFISQYVLSEEAKDKVKFGISSKKLLSLGWPEDFKGSLKSIPAAYLVGYFMGKKILKEKLKQPIVDLGMVRSLHKTKQFGFLKGLIDSGLKIDCKKEAFPEEDRIIGKSMKKDFSEKFKEIKEKIN